MQVKGFFAVLGHEVKDRVTGFCGVADSVCFDLYGCVMVSITPKHDMKIDKEKLQGRWFDHKRLEKIGKKAVMECPDFRFGEEDGPADKAPR